METDRPRVSPLAIQPTNPVALLRALKGAAASCLLALILRPEASPDPPTSAWLEHVTGYSANTVRDALHILLDLGLVQRPSRNGGIQLCPGVRQLLVGAQFDPPPMPGEDASNREIAPPPSRPARHPYPQIALCHASFRANVLVLESKSLEVEENRSPPLDLDSPCEPQNHPIAVPRLLHAPADLFGEPVHGSLQLYPDAPEYNLLIFDCEVSGGTRQSCIGPPHKRLKLHLDSPPHRYILE